MSAPTDQAMEKAREILHELWPGPGRDADGTITDWDDKDIFDTAAALDAFAAEAVREEREMHIETLREMIVLLQDRRTTQSGIADRCHSRLAQLYLLIDEARGGAR